MSEWIKNTGGCPVSVDILVDVKIDGREDHPNYNTTGAVANSWHWELYGSDDVTHWRLHKPEKKAEKFLEDAYDDPESSNEIFGATDHVNNMHEMPFTFPETTYQPLPSTNSRSLECRLAEAMSVLHNVSIDSKIVAQIIRLAKEMEE